MKRVIVRYRVKTGRRGSQTRCWSERSTRSCGQTQPSGFSYATFKLDDGVRLRAHVVVEG